MGYTFRRNKCVLWSPGNDVAMALLDALRFWERRLGEINGLSEYMPGVVQIDPTVVGEFLGHFAEQMNTDHEALCLISRGPVVLLMALQIASLEVGTQITYPSKIPLDWQAEAVKYASRWQRYQAKNDK